MGTSAAETQDLLQRIQRLNEIGVLLSAEHDHEQLLEEILAGAQELTYADGGTIYILTEENQLLFAIVCNLSLGLRWGGKRGERCRFPAIPLYDSSGQPNERTVVAYSVLHEETICLDDVYAADGYDFSGTRQFDNRSGYRSRSILVVPLKNQNGRVIGALQLINRLDPVTRAVGSFTSADRRLAESLASQAAITLSRRRLIANLNGMFDSLVEVIAEAVDSKSPYTGQHCRRVPEITMALAEAVNGAEDGPFASTSLSSEELYELRVASWLHDCGKVVTPVHVVDKRTRLETVVDRIDLITLRFEILYREEKLAHARGELSDEQLEVHLARLEEEWNFLKKCNQAATVIDTDDAARVEAIAERSWVDRQGELQPLLEDKEVENLQITRGTLNAGEREVVNEHVTATMRMLEKLPYPPHLRQVPEIAASHHERVDGRGYPRGLSGEQMSLQAKMLAVADVFEALSSADRPYRGALTLSQTLNIMEKMARNGHLDPELVSLFLGTKAYREYVQRHLKSEQLDVSL